MTSTPKSPGPRFCNQRVHVGAVHVEQAAFGVHEFGDLVNLLLEKRPAYFGLVTISAATSSFICAASAATSTMPRSFDFKFSTA